jgi:predicted transcriptional regulator
MTVLDRLVKRGTVHRKKTGRSFTYTPRVGREALRTLAVKELVDAFFDGSAEQLLNYLETAYAERAVTSTNHQPEPVAVTNSLDTELL